MEKKEENDSHTVIDGGNESKFVSKVIEAGFFLLWTFPCWTGFGLLLRSRRCTRKPNIYLSFLLPKFRSCQKPKQTPPSTTPPPAPHYIWNGVKREKLVDY
jgi:hypothetical protein